MIMAMVALGLFLPVVVLVTMASLATPIYGSCSSGDSSHATTVSYSQAYSQRFVITCGWLGWSRCTRYRTRYRTAYMSETTCCPGFSGSSCTEINECASNPCLNGGACSDQRNRFSCSCASGWSGSRCQYDVNECSSNPCSTRGQCNNLQNAYNCTCNSGWIGTTCQTEIDECDSDPCMHGGSCYDQINSFYCICPGGWIGTTCQTDYNECSSGPCLNGGTCTNLQNAYSCTSCNSGWTGTRCQTDVDECLSNPCLNGGYCTNLENAFRCTCNSGWMGTRCQTDVDECSSNPCLNEVTCINLQNAFSCTCNSGWTGARCEDEINECESGPCRNDGDCEDKVNAFLCDCQSGWTGTTCEADVNECLPNPCVHGGICNNLQNAFSCTCVNGWTGTMCEEDFDECYVRPCHNEGICHNLQDAFSCTCMKGWTGPTCDEDVDECAFGHDCSQRCIDNGMGMGYSCACYQGYQLQPDGITCQDIDECDVVRDCSQGCSNTEGSYICSCNDGYSLDIDMRTCNEIDECLSNPCNHGACTDLLNSYSCTCSPGWLGFQCNNDIDECSSADMNACSQICTNTAGSYDCFCTAGYALHHDGTTCNDINECLFTNDCTHICKNTVGAYSCSCHPGYSLHVNGFTCTDIDECSSADMNACSQICTNTAGSYDCSCTAGYELHHDGTTCNDINECLFTNDCTHICNNTVGAYLCLCRPGYSLHVNGFTCIDVDECASSPCYEDGTWTCNNLENAYDCLCNSGWRGMDCELDVNECQEGSPCNQTCANSPGSFVCSCNPGYYLDVDGVSCPGVDECSPNPCLNGAECNNLLNAFSCDCPPGWEGHTCEIDINECNSGPCLNEGTCVDRLNSFTCNCTDGWFGISCQSGYCALDPCLNGGTCIPSERQCACSSLYAGTTCNIDQTQNGVPTVTSHPRSKTVGLSEMVVLNCEFQDVLHFDWWRDGKKVPDTRDISSYVIDEMSPSDQAYYSCVGITENGPHIESNQALLTIRDMSIFHLKFKLVRNFTTFHADQESSDYKSLVRDIKEKFEAVFEALETERDTSGTIYIHVNQLLPDDGVLVDMRAYIANSSMPTQDEMNLLWSGLFSVAEISDGFFDPSILLVLSTVLCPNTSWSSPYGTVQFSSGDIHSWSASSGKCPWFTVNDGEPIARAVCYGDYISPCAWVPSDNCGGNKTADQLLIYLRENLMTAERNTHDILSVLTVISQDTNITPASVNAVLNILHQIGSIYQPTQENVALVVDILSILATLDKGVIMEAEMMNGAVSRATMALENILLAVDVPSNQTFQQMAANLVVQVINSDSDGVGDGIVFSIIGDDGQSFDESNIQLSTNNLDNGNLGGAVQAAIAIGPETIDEGTMGNIAFTVYRDDALFVMDGQVGSSDGRRNITVNTNIIGASLGTSETTPLNASVTITLAHKQQNATNPQCVYWEYSTNAWSSEGCDITITSETHTECQCNHLTSFAVLMDVSAIPRRSERVERVFRTLSYIGCSLSIVGLLVTLVVYITDRKLRCLQHIRILMCLCITLLFLYVFFIIMTALDRHPGESEVGPGLCGVIAAVLHFTTLSSMSWMGVEGINMFLMVVRVMDSYIPLFMMKASIVAWGLPAAIVLLTGVISRQNYSNSDFCFLQKWPLVGGLLIPMAFILAHNLIIFALVMRRLMRIKSGGGKASELKLEARHEIMRRLKNGIGVVLLLGLTWLVGYFTVIEQLNLAVHVIFILLNSLQGFFIFVFYVLRQPQSRARLREHLGCCFHDSFSVTRSGPLSMKQTTMTGTDNPISGNESVLSKSEID